MVTKLSGPMFEGAEDTFWKSTFNRQGAHYNTYGLKDDAQGVAALKEFFPTAEADGMNFVLFSTSGVHGMYTTIEEIEASLLKYSELIDDEDEDKPEDWCYPSITFLIVQPRLVCSRYGNADVTLEDIPYLKQLRASSHAAMAKIGLPE